jgi:mannitol/fructose-specific phosphotransferase system IIA component (Ntr-type)
MPTTRTPTLAQLLVPARIRVGLRPPDKAAAIDALVHLLAGHEAIRDLDNVRAAVREREEKMSTGVGKGLGLPHAKTPAATDTLLAFATTDAPVDFGAVDDVPVRLLLLVVGPDEHKSEHIRILGRISRLVSHKALRNRLVAADTPQEILDTLRDGEQALRT